MAYADTVLADSPAWYWRIPTGGANAVASIGTHHEWLAGGTAAGFQFGWTGPGRGAGSYLAVAGPQMFAQTNISLGPQLGIEYWTYGGGEQQGTAQATQVEFQIGSGTPISTFIGIGRTLSAWSVITHTGPISTTGITRTELTWHHLVLQTNATGYDFYVDGSLVHSFAATLDTLSGFVTTLQRSITFPCWFAEPAIYSGPLTSTRIAAHYAAGALTAPSYSNSLASCG